MAKTDWAAIYAGQSKVFDQLGGTASGLGGCPCGCEGIDGHKVANAIWAMAAFLKHRAEIEDQIQQGVRYNKAVSNAGEADAAAKLRAAREEAGELA